MTNEHEMMVEEIVSELEVKMNRLTPAGGFMLENGGYSTIFLKDWLRTTLTTLTQHHEAEVERYKAALEDINSVTPADAERWGYYETLNKIVGRTNEALTPTKTDNQ